MHILIRRAGSINSTLLLPLKNLLPENESQVSIGRLSDLDCKMHCYSLRPYVALWRHVSPQIICFPVVFLYMYESLCNMRHCICSLFNFQMDIYRYIQASTILDAVFLFQWNQTSVISFTYASVFLMATAGCIQLPHTVQYLLLLLKNNPTQKPPLHPKMIDCSNIFHVHDDILTIPVTYNKSNFALCFIIDYNVLSHISVC